MKPFQKILVPIDFSSHSDQALATAVDLAGRYGASISLLHVFEPAVLAWPNGSAVMTSMQVADALDDIKRALDKEKEKASALGAKQVEIIHKNGYPPSEILERARADGFDLIVMGTHGRTGLSHFIMGSVAERVVRMAPCSVLAVRSEPAS